MSGRHNRRRGTGAGAYSTTTATTQPLEPTELRIPPRGPRNPARLAPRDTGLVPEDADRHPAAVYLASLGTAASRRGMRSALERAARLLGRGNAADARWHELRYAHTTLLRTLLIERDYAPATANKILAAVRGTLRAAWRLGRIDGETYRQAIAIKPVRGERLPRGRALEPGEIGALFGVLDGEEPGDARDGALLALLYGCGLRRAEAAAVTLNDIDREQATIRIRGKGNRERTAHLNHGCAAAVENWIRHRGEDAGPLLLQVDRHGNVLAGGLSPEAVRLRLERTAARAGTAHCSPHDLRRSYVSALLDNGNDITTVAAMAGHRNVQTTSRYDRRGERAARKAAQTLHVPRIRGS